MKTGRKQCLRLFLTACVLWGMVGVLPVAAAGEATSLEGAEIRLSSYQMKYSGQPQTPEVELSIGGVSGITLVNGEDYTLSYTDNVNVGTATVTATGRGRYTGSVKSTFEIIPYPLQSNNFSFNKATCIKSYDGTCDGTMTVKVSVEGKEFTTNVKVMYDNEYVGSEKTVAIHGKDLLISGEERKNYTVDVS